MVIVMGIVKKEHLYEVC